MILTCIQLLIFAIIYPCFIIVRNENDDVFAEQNLGSARQETEVWIGRRVRKKFGRHGWFAGRITAVDDDAENDGHILFQCTYTDGDNEWISQDELDEILLPEESSVRYLLPQVIGENANINSTQHIISGE